MNNATTNNDELLTLTDLAALTASAERKPEGIPVKVVRFYVCGNSIGVVLQHEFTGARLATLVKGRTAREALHNLPEEMYEQTDWLREACEQLDWEQANDADLGDASILNRSNAPADKPAKKRTKKKPAKKRTKKKLATVDLDPALKAIHGSLKRDADLAAAYKMRDEIEVIADICKRHQLKGRISKKQRAFVKRLATRRAEWLASDERPVIIEWLAEENACDESDWLAEKFISGIEKYGSPKAWMVEKAMGGYIDERMETLTATAGDILNPCHALEGRHELAGRVEFARTKGFHNLYEVSTKIQVRLRVPAGSGSFTAWVTLSEQKSAELLESYGLDGSETLASHDSSDVVSELLTGQTIEVRATLERDDEDPTHAWGSRAFNPRPAGLRALAEVAAAYGEVTPAEAEGLGWTIADHEDHGNRFGCHEDGDVIIGEDARSITITHDEWSDTPERELVLGLA